MEPFSKLTVQAMRLCCTGSKEDRTGVGRWEVSSATKRAIFTVPPQQEAEAAIVGLCSRLILPETRQCCTASREEAMGRCQLQASFETLLATFMEPPKTVAAVSALMDAEQYSDWIRTGWKRSTGSRGLQMGNSPKVLCLGMELETSTVRHRQAASTTSELFSC